MADLKTMQGGGMFVTCVPGRRGHGFTGTVSDRFRPFPTVSDRFRPFPSDSISCFEFYVRNVSFQCVSLYCSLSMFHTGMTSVESLNEAKFCQCRATSSAFDL